MKLIGLIGVSLFILLSEISFSRNEENEEVIVDFSSRPYLKLDYDVMTPGKVVVGKDVHFKCIYPSANETLTVKEYKFFFEKKMLDNEPENGITIFGDTLTIQNVSKTHIGKYFCVIRNSRSRNRPGEDFILDVPDSTNPNNPDFQGLPILHLELGGNNTNINAVSRFNNVSLTCSAKPNSGVIKRIIFLRNGEKIGEHYVGLTIFSKVTLELPRIEMNSRGKYYCEAITVFGDIFSNPLPLIVMNVPYHPLRATSYLNLTANLGREINANEIQEFDDIEITCDITPSSPIILPVTWFRNFKNLPENIENGIIHQHTKLILKHVTKSSMANYSCMVDTDQGLLMSNAVNIQVKDNVTAMLIVSEKFKSIDIETLCPDVWRLLHLPHIPRARLQLGSRYQKNKEVLTEFDSVYFTCTVTPITAKVRNIRWFLNEKELVPNITVGIINHPSTLIFPCIKKRHNYAGKNITCLAEIDGDTNPRSNALIMEIADADRAADTPCKSDNPALFAELLHHPKFIYINQPAVWLHCHIFPKHIPFRIDKIVWYLDDQELKPQQIVNGTLPANLPEDYVTQHGQSLKIHRIKESYIGKYQCQIKNGKGHQSTFSNPATISDVKDRNRIPSWRIATPPTVIAELLHDLNSIYENDAVFFYCNVKPKTLIERRVLWFRNDELFDAMVHKNVFINNHTLRLNKIKKSHAGNFSCLVETTVGTFTSEPTTLKIKSGAKFYRNPWDAGEVFPYAKLGDPSEAKNIYEKDNIYFSCEIVPPKTTLLEIIWLHNDTRLYPNRTDTIELSDRILYLHNIQRSAAGKYQCQANTKKGLWESVHIYLNVKEGAREYEYESKWFTFRPLRFG